MDCFLAIIFVLFVCCPDFEFLLCVEFHDNSLDYCCAKFYFLKLLLLDSFHDIFFDKRDHIPYKCFDARLLLYDLYKTQQEVLLVRMFHKSSHHFR